MLILFSSNKRVTLGAERKAPIEICFQLESKNLTRIPQETYDPKFIRDY
jgi:hypothetical protein